MRFGKLTLAGTGALMLSFAGTSAADVTATAAAAAQPTAAQNAAKTRAETAAQTNTRAVLEIRALDKITGHASVIYAPLNEPVKYETLTITARKCYSTPPSEPPETSAFLQIEDHRPGQKAHQVFSGWMYVSTPGINGMEHPLYDVWVVKCRASAPDQTLPQTEVTVSPQDEADTDADDDPNAASAAEDSSAGDSSPDNSSADNGGSGNH